jgi:hypothetical protein
VAEVGAGVVSEQHGDEAKARGMISWVGARSEVRGRRGGALTVGADDVGSALATSCGDGLVAGSSMPGLCSGR